MPLYIFLFYRHVYTTEELRTILAEKDEEEEKSISDDKRSVDDNGLCEGSDSEEDNVFLHPDPSSQVNLLVPSSQVNLPNPSATTNPPRQ